MGLVLYSLTEPWARARIVLFWGITRSPGALVLVLVTTLSMLVAGVAVAGRGNSLRRAAFVHLASGAVMCAVSWRAYQMVQEAGIKALGFIPLASVRPGAGLQAFFAAALAVLAVGNAELVIALVQSRRARRAPAPSASPARGDDPVGTAGDAGKHVRA